MIPFMTALCVAICVGIIVYAVTLKQKCDNVQRDGITTDATVVKSVHVYKYANTTVCFTGDDGRGHEARIVTRFKMKPGTQVQIAYMPGNYDNVVMVMK